MFDFFKEVGFQFLPAGTKILDDGWKLPMLFKSPPFLNMPVLIGDEPALDFPAAGMLCKVVFPWLG